MVTDRAPNIKSFPAEQRKPFKASKPKKWSHQHELEEAIGKTLRIANLSGEVVDAKLVAADAFTVRLELDDGIVTIFKHSISGYGVL